MKTNYRVRYCSDPECSCKMPRRGKLYTHINKRVRIRINKIVLVTVIIGIAIAAFVSVTTIQDKTKRQNQLKNQIHQLEIKQAEEVQRIQTEKQQELDKTKQDYDKQIEQLNKEVKDLQAKRQEKARLASIQATVAPVIGRGGVSTSCEAYRGLVSQYAWDTNIAMAIMRAESGCNPMAANLTDSHSTCKGSFGLFQIACFDGQVYDPAQNVAIAYRKYKASGWRPWGVYTSGAYLRYL